MATYHPTHIPKHLRPTPQHICMCPTCSNDRARRQRYYHSLPQESLRRIQRALRGCLKERLDRAEEEYVLAYTRKYPMRSHGYPEIILKGNRIGSRKKYGEGCDCLPCHLIYRVYNRAYQRNPALKAQDTLNWLRADPANMTQEDLLRSLLLQLPSDRQLCIDLVHPQVIKFVATYYPRRSAKLARLREIEHRDITQIFPHLTLDPHYHLRDIHTQLLRCACDVMEPM